MQFRIGQGIDLHQFAKDRKLILGGVEIPYEFGLIGHSDADALLHSIIDALLGAAGKSDIGTYFPDNSERWRNVSSIELLKIVWSEVSKDGWRLVNLDSTVLTELPKLNPYIPEMKKRISQALQVEIQQIGIKAGTTEKMGSIGRGEGLLAQSVVLISK